MPIYEYKCAKGHVFEAIQSMSDDPLTACEQCGAPVERVFHPIAVHFKGSGFYSTDYGSKGKSGGDGQGKEDKGGADSSEKSTDSSEKKKDSGTGTGAKDKAPAKSDSKSSD